MSLTTVDVEYRNRPYRIVDTYRSLGASIRPVEALAVCGECARHLRPGVRHYRNSTGFVVRCIRCAIRGGYLRLAV